MEKICVFFSTLQHKCVKGFVEHLDKGGNSVASSCYDFTDHRMTEEEFESVFKILKQKGLLILPQINLMGYIKNYAIYTQRGNILLAFSEKNLPQGETLKNIFDKCKDDYNLFLLKTLKQKQQFLNLPNVLDSFADYAY